MKNEILPVTRAPSRLSPDQAETLAQAFFKAKQPMEDEGRNHAWVMHGAPGSGKTSVARGLFYGNKLPAPAHIVMASADKAMETIPAYHEAMKDKQAFHRPAIWRDLQNDAEYIRDRVLDYALLRKYNVLVDSTASDETGLDLIQTLRDLDYTVTLVSCYAPLDVCTERLKNRDPAMDSGEALMSRRAGALASLFTLAHDAAGLRLFAAHASHAHILEAVASHGERASITNLTVLQDMLKDLKDEGKPGPINALTRKGHDFEYYQTFRKLGQDIATEVRKRIGLPYQNTPLRGAVVTPLSA